MKIAPISAPYQPTLGPMAQLHESDTVALGDPAKVAQVILRRAELDEPPLRLILGSEAYAYATAAAERQAESDSHWRDLTISTDRDDATLAQRDPLGTQ
jgi:hypothetical protein